MDNMKIEPDISLQMLAIIEISKKKLDKLKRGISQDIEKCKNPEFYTSFAEFMPRLITALDLMYQIFEGKDQVSGGDKNNRNQN